MLPDQRIRLSSTKIDFINDVGETGQDHDMFPQPGQARYDHMRMYLLGLLCNQAAFSEPTQFREGTLWFDLNDKTLKVRLDDAWQSLQSVIAVSDGVTLADFYATVSEFLASFAPEVTFSGVVTADTTHITIPSSLRSSVTSNTKIFLYVNGLLLDPRTCELDNRSNPTTVKLNSGTLALDDTFTVVLKNFSASHFYGSTVSAP